MPVPKRTQSEQDRVTGRGFRLQSRREFERVMSSDASVMSTRRKQNGRILLPFFYVMIGRVSKQSLELFWIFNRSEFSGVEQAIGFELAPQRIINTPCQYHRLH